MKLETKPRLMIILLLFIAAGVLFVSNYEICIHRYPLPWKGQDSIGFWKLKQNFYNVVIMLACIGGYNSISLLSEFLNEKLIGWIRVFANILCALCISNCIDRIFFDVTQFTEPDKIMLAMTAVEVYFKERKFLWPKMR